MAPTHSDAERTFISLFLHATLESFRASPRTHESQQIPDVGLGYWVNVAELRRWLEQRDAPAPAIFGIRASSLSPRRFLKSWLPVAKRSSFHPSRLSQACRLMKHLLMIPPLLLLRHPSFPLPVRTPDLAARNAKPTPLRQPSQRRRQSAARRIRCWDGDVHCSSDRGKKYTTAREFADADPVGFIDEWPKMKQQMYTVLHLNGPDNGSFLPRFAGGAATAAGAESAWRFSRRGRGFGPEAGTTGVYNVSSAGKLGSTVTGGSWNASPPEAMISGSGAGSDSMPGCRRLPGPGHRAARAIGATRQRLPSNPIPRQEFAGIREYVAVVEDLQNRLMNVRSASECVGAIGTDAERAGSTRRREGSGREEKKWVRLCCRNPTHQTRQERVNYSLRAAAPETSRTGMTNGHGTPSGV
ncbi:hypothetical protein GGX14DRAFT_542197 [Mycena pura]|uniref:Uncharacterized protein n=1 Tax=Mycena pura TaxID=153505 RepID=A0AAD6YHT3_9AGAR|nr:hypothetical protein GGX14DRAFT_542197 [Mycena pura]